MSLPAIEPTGKQAQSNSVTSREKSSSTASSSAITADQWLRETDKHLWRAIDFLHITVMISAIYTAMIVAILRNELAEQCPLYAKLYLHDNVTLFSAETIDRQTVWGGVHTCEFVSFAYLSAFVVSFISLWIHIVFRRVLRTERLLRLPIGVFILAFTFIAFVATIIVTDGVVKFCTTSPGKICSSSGPEVFSSSRWKIISLPIGGWLTTVTLLLNVLVRGIQLFSKPKKSHETVKLLLNQLMPNRNSAKFEKDSSEYGSQISRQSIERNRLQPLHRHSIDPVYNREFTTTSIPSELYPYNYPPIPQYRQIEKRSRFRRICCSCFSRRRRRRRRQPSIQEPYRPFVVPDEYFHRLNNLKQNGAAPPNLCYHHSMHHPVERQTQTDSLSQRKSIDEINEIPYLPRRRSSVRFEDEIPSAKVLDVSSTTTPKTETIPIAKQDNEEARAQTSDNNLERNVSFRNNEDDLWTTITVNADPGGLVQSSHFNRLSLENLSTVDTSMANTDNRVTAIQVNNIPMESTSPEPIEIEIVHPPQSSSKVRSNRHKSLPPPPPPPSSMFSRSVTTSSEYDSDLSNIKPVEEIHAIVTDKYNYTNLSQALKSNVERLKTTFIHAQETQAHYDTPKNFRTKLSQKSFQNPNTSYPELLAYLHQPDTRNRNALLAHSYEQFYARAAPFTTPLLSMLLLCSTYLTVLLSGDRYFLICWPLLAEKIRSRKTSLRLVLLVIIIVNIYILPHWFEYRTETRAIKSYLSSTNSTVNYSSSYKLVELTYTRLGSNTIYLSIYRFYLNVPITFVIPFTLLTLCNGSMIHQLVLIKKKKKRLGQRMKADIRITIMLIVIVLTFMLCRSINLFVNLLVQLSPCLNKNSLQRFNTFANLLIAFNGFINFFLFAAFGQRFREMILYIVCRREQYPFRTNYEGGSVNRCGPTSTMAPVDHLRQILNRLSSSEIDSWGAIAHRRSSATMVTLYNSLDNQPRLRTPTTTSGPHLHIPICLKETKNSSMKITLSPFMSSSNQQLLADSSLLTESNNNHESNSSLIFIKVDKLDDQAQTNSALHVTCV
ncbi:unnamed protein product [Rotaria magnacalcarata]|uniref:G-protein coupled receptors family 1 profile domain-containing protein n=1 Tax=Rotaria magnacalcarata TaxID=392030 RepID=A0A816QM27_9BILA|nr:unnamed protein product [Rotaria magnacalcarata]